MYSTSETLATLSKIPDMQRRSQGRKWVHLLLKRGGTEACGGRDCSPVAGKNHEVSSNKNHKQSGGQAADAGAGMGELFSATV